MTDKQWATRRRLGILVFSFPWMAFLLNLWCICRFGPSPQFVVQAVICGICSLAVTGPLVFLITWRKA